MSVCEDGQVFERRNSLQVDAVKCAKITNMFAAEVQLQQRGRRQVQECLVQKAAAGVAPRCKTDYVVDSEEEEEEEEDDEEREETDQGPE